MAPPQGFRGWSMLVAVVLVNIIYSQVAGALRKQSGHATIDGVTPWADAGIGDILKVKLKDLIPTQACLGKSQIHYHLGRKQPNLKRFPKHSEHWLTYMKKSVFKRGDDYCKNAGMKGLKKGSWKPETLNISNPSTFACKAPEATANSDYARDVKTAVIGPGGKVYVTDGHHTFTTMMELADGGPELTVFVRITKNWKDDTEDEFWSHMKESLLLWLRDAEDKNITTNDLPKGLGLSSFSDDPFRTLVRLTKGMAYSTANNPQPFVEFKWGSWLRRNGLDVTRYNFSDLSQARISLDETGKPTPLEGDSNSSYMALVRDVAIKMVSAADGEVIDDGQNASVLGKLPWPDEASAWNEQMHDKIQRGDLKTSGAPRTGGRTWYAMKYEQCGGAASTQPECWHGEKGKLLASAFV